jgi:hypothetical protein
MGRPETLPFRNRVMADVPLNAAQEAEAQRLFELLQAPFLDEARRLARLLAAKPDAQPLGKTEFEVRDSVHRLGAAALQAALDERKKGATKAPA